MDIIDDLIKKIHLVDDDEKIKILKIFSKVNSLKIVPVLLKLSVQGSNEVKFHARKLLDEKKDMKLKDIYVSSKLKSNSISMIIANFLNKKIGFDELLADLKEYKHNLDMARELIYNETNIKILATFAKLIPFYYKEKNAIELLKLLVKCDNERVVANSIESFGKYKNNQIIAVVSEFLSSKSHRILSATILVLNSYMEEDVLFAIEKMVLSDQVSMKVSAIIMIANINVNEFNRDRISRFYKILEKDDNEMVKAKLKKLKSL